MSDPQPSLFLSRLTHDIRLEIYSYIILPPFDGCGDYAGLLLSCQQLKEEMDDEGTRQLWIYLNSIDKDTPVEFYSDYLSHKEFFESRRPNNLDLMAPSTVLGSPRIGVNVPFWLPPTEHDWYHQGYSFGRFCRVSQPRYPPSVWQIAERKRNKEEVLYEQQLNQLLKPIRLLHALHVSIDVCLTMDTSTSTRIAQDEMLERELKNSQLQPRLLGTTVLGRLLDRYMTRLSDQGRTQMSAWSENWAFNARKMNVTWDFTNPLFHEQGRWYHGAPIVCRSVSNQASCSEDRREGTVQIAFDVVHYVQNSLIEIKRQIRVNKCIARVGIHLSMGKDRTVALVKERTKLQKLGIEEGEEPEPNNFEIKVAQRIEERLKERESAEAHAQSGSA